MRTDDFDFYDAIVIGAGPAGAVSALQLSRQGWRVLLLERSTWPREKVCGGCVNADSIALLQSIGIRLPSERPLNRCVIHAAHRSVEVALPGGCAINRAALDQMLVAAAVAAGCTFLSCASASVSPESSTAQQHAPTGRRDVVVTHEQSQRRISARWILACDGINGSALARLPWATWQISPRSHIGLAATIAPGAMTLPRGEIHMHISNLGYVGRVRHADGSIHLAAAIDPSICQQHRSPDSIAREILRDSSSVDLPSHRWSGIGKLTRQRKCLGDDHVLVVGDACGYVEPFTGQGIAWAIESAIGATLMLIAANPAKYGLARRWEMVHRATVRRHQLACHAVRLLIRQPVAVNIAMHAFKIWPSWPQRIISPLRAIA